MSGASPLELANIFQSYEQKYGSALRNDEANSL